MLLPRRGRRRGPLLLRRPGRVLAFALALAITLGILGSGVEGRLQPTSLSIAGTPSWRANAMLRGAFGESAPFAILLRGPAAQLERQGPALVRALRHQPGVTTLSPWDGGSLRNLRPAPGRALVLADFHVGIDRAVRESVPELEAILARRVHAPVRAIQSGYATVERALQQESIAASEHGELIALPVLLVVLLLVFRSPVAAAIPLAFGALTVLASRGLLYILTFWLGIDAFALTVCTMIGLALGVDYTLLLVSRFREELAAGRDPVSAARVTRATAGRTTVFAGATLLLSMIVALFAVPGSLLASLAGAVAVVVALSVCVSLAIVPALLALIGANLDRWRLGVVRAERSRLMALVTSALRRPAPIAALIGAVVLLLAAPAIALRTGSPGPQQLARSDPARRDIETIYRAIGPGWNAPFQIVATARSGPITTASRLAALARAQRRIAGLPGVHAVIGPGSIARQLAPLRASGDSLLGPVPLGGALGRLGGLGRRLLAAASGVSRLRKGLTAAASGAGLLGEGSRRALAGERALAGGLALAGAGAQRVSAALGSFGSGARRLAAAQGRASFGVLQLRLALHDLGPNLRDNALVRAQRLEAGLSEAGAQELPRLIDPARVVGERLDAALTHLHAMSAGRSDPEYGATLEALREASSAFAGHDPQTGQAYAPGYAGLPGELASLHSGLLADAEDSHQVTSWLLTVITDLKTFSAGAARLLTGVQRIQRGVQALAHGSLRLGDATAALHHGLAHLLAGASALQGGIGRLGGGAHALSENLAAGYGRSAPLQSGLGAAGARLISNGAVLHRRLGAIHAASPHLFDSGYFVLSALDGAPPARRAGAAEAVDLSHGGQAASIFVISDYNFNTAGSIALNRRLDGIAAHLGRRLGISAGVAGGAAQLNEYGALTAASIPYVVAAIAIATFLALVVVLRALPLAAIAVLLNLATVAVAFGVITLLFNLPAGFPLGGHTYVDTVGATIIFGIVFGLSIDYAVFLLTRMKEHRDRDSGIEVAVGFGLEKTARVITGAAAIMMAVFIAFAGAPIATVSQLGAGLTVAVLLDATAVRIVLLPALMLLIGERVWWLPRPLERVLPRLDV